MSRAHPFFVKYAVRSRADSPLSQPSFADGITSRHLQQAPGSGARSFDQPIIQSYIS